MDQTFNYYFPEDRDMINVSHSQTGCKASNTYLASSDSDAHLLNAPHCNMPKKKTNLQKLNTTNIVSVLSHDMKKELRELCTDNTSIEAPNFSNY